MTFWYLAYDDANVDENRTDKKDSVKSGSNNLERTATAII